MLIQLIIIPAIESAFPSPAYSGFLEFDRPIILKISPSKEPKNEKIKPIIEKCFSVAQQAPELDFAYYQ